MIDRRNLLKSVVGGVVSVCVPASTQASSDVPTEVAGGVDDRQTHRQKVIDRLVSNQIIADPKYVDEVRQFYEHTNLFDVVGVQPMNGPAALIYFMKTREVEPDGYFSTVGLSIDCDAVASRSFVPCDVEKIIINSLVECVSLVSDVVDDQQLSVLNMANVIHARTLLGRPGSMVVNETSIRLLDRSCFVPSAPYGHDGLKFVGSYSFLKVFTSPHIDEDLVLLCLCENVCRAGFVAAPFVHHTVTGSDCHLTRLGLKVINSDHYGLLRLK